MNVSEIVEANINTSIISDSWNCYKFNHATETHQWIRMWNRKQLEWSGRIHEENKNTKRCDTPIFQMADTQKDVSDPFKAAVMDIVKSLCYENQYAHIIEKPEDMDGTNFGWLRWAIEQNPSM